MANEIACESNLRTVDLAARRHRARAIAACRTLFDDFSMPHYRDMVCNVSHHSKVLGNEKFAVGTSIQSAI
jgi:hypothetical protein